MAQTSLQWGLLGKHKPWKKGTFPRASPAPGPAVCPPRIPPSGAGASARGPGEAPDRSLQLHAGGFSPCCCGPGESPLGAVGMGTSRPRRGSAPASREQREGKLFLEQELFWEGSVLLSQPGQNSKGNCTRAPPQHRILFLSPKSSDPTMG